MTKITLRLVIVASLFIGWIWYVLAFSNIPVTYTAQIGLDLKIITCFFSITLFALVCEMVLSEKNKSRGSYLVLVVGSVLLFLWFVRYSNGFNYKIREELINVYEKRIVVAGILINALSVFVQIFRIMRFAIRGRRERE